MELDSFVIGTNKKQTDVETWYLTVLELNLEGHCKTNKQVNPYLEIIWQKT